MHKIISKQLIFLVLIILLAAFLRFFRLGDFPITLNHDEISQLYDTASILETKKDIYGNFLPLVFQSTGDYKVGYLTYLSVIPYLLSSGSEISTRITTAFFGTLTILAVFLFIKILTKNWIIAIISAFVVAITPSEIFSARKSFETVIGICLTFFGFYSLIKKYESNNRKWGYLGAVLLATAMYIYSAYTLVIPILLILFFVLFNEQFNIKKRFVNELFVLIILLIPLFIISFTNPEIKFRPSTVFVGQDPNLGNLINLTGNSVKPYFDFILARYLNQFNPIFLFVDGLDLTNQGLYDLGPLLIWQAPLVLFGFIFFIRHKKYSRIGTFLSLASLIAMIPSSITFEEFSPHRAVFSFTLISIISAFGLYWIINHILSMKWLKVPLMFFIFSSLLFNIVYAIRLYTISYPYEKSEKLQYPFEDVIKYAWSQYSNFDHIVFDPQFGEIRPIIGVGSQYYLGYYGKVPPEQFQQKFRVGGKPREVIFDKFSVRKVNWAEDNNLKNTLLIVSSWTLTLDPQDKRIIKRFVFYNGSPAFYAIKL